MKDIKEIVREPIFFERNRVYRIYLGGKQYTKIFDNKDGYDDGTDNFFPEEWIASKVKAINPRYFGERDGVSVVKGTEIFFDDLLNEHKAELLGGVQMQDLELTHQVTAVIQRSYHADG